MAAPSRPGLRLALLAFALLGFLAVGRLWTNRTPEMNGFVQGNGLPIGGDFVVFYAASKLTLAGEAAAAYDQPRQHALQQQVIGAEFPLAPWLYPPPALLVAAPLAALPYPVALGAWLLLGVGGLLLVCRRLAPSGFTLFWVLAFPGVLVNLGTGQNGLLSGVVLGLGFLWLEERPLQAGAVLGLLSLKPQLLPAVLVALAAGGRWRALGALVASAATLALASLALFGAAPWEGFRAALAPGERLLDATNLRRIRMPTWYCAARSLGAGVGAARGLQAVAGLVAAGALAWLWRRPAPAGLRHLGLALGIGLVTPYVFDYDLGVLAVGLAATATRVPPPGPLAALLWALPLMHGLVLGGLGVPLGPPVMAAGLAWCCGTARSAPLPEE